MVHSAAAPEVTITPMLKTRAAIRRLDHQLGDDSAPTAQIRMACATA